MATLVRWNTARWTPIREVASMQNELSRLMNGLFEGSPRQSQAWVPTLDAWETADAYVFAADLPGVAQESISVEAEEGLLTISAERERPADVTDENTHLLERRHGSFERTIALPKGIAEGSITASYKDGVLEVHVPKPEQVKPTKVVIGFDVKPTTIEGTATVEAPSEGSEKS